MAPARRRWLRRGGWLAGLVLCGAVWAQAPAGAIDPAAERARIARERAAVQATFERAQRDCAERFAVNACLQEAHARRREALDSLNRQREVMDTSARRRRAAERMQRIGEKMAAPDGPYNRPAVVTRAARAPGRPPSSVSPREPPREARPGESTATTSRARSMRLPVAAGASAPSPRLTPADQVRKREAYEQRQAEAQARREKVQRRLAERASQPRAAAGLPPRPDAASSGLPPRPAAAASSVPPASAR